VSGSPLCTAVPGGRPGQGVGHDTAQSVSARPAAGCDDPAGCLSRDRGSRCGSSARSSTVRCGSPRSRPPRRFGGRAIVDSRVPEGRDPGARALRGPRRTAADGFFVDAFRGRDLYQRFGGGPKLGYGDAPVALHLYEIG
jgi:hypothetical protein